jgi:hypothetical protein
MMMACIVWSAFLGYACAETSAPTAAPSEEDNSLVKSVGFVALGLLGFNFLFMAAYRTMAYFGIQAATKMKAQSTAGDASQSGKKNKSKRLVI